MIAIVTYNGQEHIERCLDSIQSKANFQIHIIDNDSKDDTVSLIKGKYPHVHLTQSSDNLGFGKANNLLLSEAITQDMDYVFLLNQDAYFIEDCIDELLVNAPQSGGSILSPVHVKKDEKTLDEGFAVYTLNGVNYKQPEFINAAGWLMPLELIKHVGGFSPLFFHYGEDRDYANRMKYNGYSFRVVKNAKLVHNREQKQWVNTQENRQKASYRFFVNILRNLSDINHSFTYGLVVITKNTLGDWFKCVLDGNWKLGFSNVWMYFKSYGQFRKILNHRNITKETYGVFLVPNDQSL